MSTFKLVGYAFVGAVVASLGVLVVGLLIFGPQIAEWTEWEGRIVGMVATTLAVVAAGVGLYRARKPGD